ncbi:uncharacterized protein E5676_scaffold411G001450 [Cucumis melo var. makuwa]|uniref:Uncharacterized protein n=1 Tax=Cucumis melo var. makuwa TaxID=1194695 RepID=A0A5A7TZB4_CUCMM|nr:uncharacterized protein E6C27_scaffold427G00380 [Cucumis melo var. makuwa]TYK18206.1 uncharacterized protein E5676_scaffold411G001450 [Cucumis melo var. makuwa]
MEGVSVSVYNGLRRYLRRKSYRKLAASVGRRTETAQLGAAGGGRRRRRIWRIKISPKLRLFRRMPSLKKLLLWLRDSYVKAMLAFANSRVIGGGSGSGGGDGIWGGAGRSTLKEYDEKMITEIYKSLVVAQGRLPPPEPVRPSWGGGRLPTVAE